MGRGIVMLPSFERVWNDGRCMKPRIQVLEISDKNKPKGKPIAWLLIERQETYERDSSGNPIREASISLYYERILPKYEHPDFFKGNFCGSYCKGGFGSSIESVSLSSTSMSGGGIFLDLTGLEGQRIGTYLLNEIVTWAQRWPEANVNRLKLIRVSNEEEKARLIRFYKQFNLDFVFDDPEHKDGISKPMKVKDLTTVDKLTENIRECELLDYLAHVIFDEREASEELKRRNQTIKGLTDESKKAEDKPLLWAIQLIWRRHWSSMVGGIIIASFVALAWFRFRAG
jgi:hypothetical protein